MKKLLLFLLVSTFAITTNAQIINIPDAIFKAFLTHQDLNPLIDTNADGEIQLSEASQITNLTIWASPVENYTGLEAFSNLETLKLQFASPAVQLDLSALINLKHLEIQNFNGMSPIFPIGTTLEYLDFSNSYFDAINVNALVSLKYLNCSGMYSPTFLSNFAINMLTNLETLIIHDTFITTFNPHDHPNLVYLDCEETNMFVLDVSSLTNLETLICSRNRLQILDVANLTSLKTLECSNTEISTLAVDNLTLLERLDCNLSNISSLNLGNLNNLIYLNCRNNDITTLNVLSLNNLTTLDVSVNPLGSIDVSTLTNLTSFSCSRTLLTTIDVSNLINLTYLDISVNPLGTINISNLTNLSSLYCYSNGLSTLDVSNASLLKTLYCSSNDLTSLNTSTLTELTLLDCQSNQITTLDLSNNHKLNSANCMNNLFTVLDFSAADDQNTQAFTCSINNNPLLTYVNLKNGKSYLEFIGGDVQNLQCPSLRYVCADEANALRIQNDLQMAGVLNVQVNSYCTFTPSGIYNTISGTLRIDLNGNGCDAADINFPNMKVGIDDGSTSGASFTNGSGNYSFFTEAGGFIITPEIEHPYFTISPVSQTVNLANIDGTVETADFCLSPNGIHNDLEVTLFSPMPARPGFDATYSLVYKNKGNQTLSGNVSLDFNDLLLDFITATPATTTQNIGNLIWNYTNLRPFESRTIEATMNVNSPMETPPVNLGDILFFTAYVSPTANDETLADNIYQFPQVVVGSFDPNDKTCLEGDTFTPEQVGDYLHYMIRFQNSGTFAAQNVVVKDVIDATKFDVSSLQLVASSHPNETRIKDNKVEFIFENINLPAEIDDEPGSHGYVIFKIKTKSNLVLGNSVSNTAEIYFDYNFPIITNTATSTVAVLGKNEYANTSVKIYPNPVKDRLNISAKDNITSVLLYDIQGRLLEAQTTSSNNVILDISQKAKGLYLLKIKTEKGVKIEKIVKE